MSESGGAWVRLTELQRESVTLAYYGGCADDPAAVHQAAVRHPGHPYYFMIPGGQMFTIAPTS